jgi:hypothetical protein
MSSAPMTASAPLPPPWRDLHKRLIVLGAAILAQRHWGDPIPLAEAEKQDVALAGLAMECRKIADEAAQEARRLSPLSDEQIGSIYRKWDDTPGASHADLMRMVEAAHGIGSKHTGG